MPRLELDRPLLGLGDDGCDAKRTRCGLLKLMIFCPWSLSLGYGGWDADPWGLDGSIIRLEPRAHVAGSRLWMLVVFNFPSLVQVPVQSCKLWCLMFSARGHLVRGERGKRRKHGARRQKPDIPPAGRQRRFPATLLRTAPDIASPRPQLQTVPFQNGNSIPVGVIL